MSLTYRCESCGLGCRVVSGALGLSGELIHCPRCGAQAHAAAEWNDTLQIVEVSLEDDGRTTHEIRALTDDTGRLDDPAHKATPEERRRALDPFADEPASTAPRLPTGGDALLRDTQQNPARAVIPESVGELTPPGTPSVVFSESARRVDGDGSRPAGEGGDAEDESARTAQMPQLRFDAAGAPRQTFRGKPAKEEPLKPGGGEVVKTHRRFPAAQVSPLSETDPSPRSDEQVDRPDQLGRTASDMAMAVFGPTEPMPPSHRPDSVPRPGSLDPVWHQKGLEGKAWSSKAVRLALSESGIEPSDEIPSLSEGAPTEKLTPLPDSHPRKQTSPDTAHTPPAAVVGSNGRRETRREDSGVRRVVVPPSSFDSGASRVTDTGRLPRYSSPRPIARRSRRRATGVSRSLALVALFVGVVCIGVVLGMLWSIREKERAQGETSYSTVDWTDDLSARADQRARMFGLRAIAADAPIRFDYQIVRLDYPERLQLRLRLVNRSSSPVTALSVQTSWYLIHEDITVVRGSVERFEPPVSLAEPLAPGEAVEATVTLTRGGALLGAARESFVWIELTATDEALEILFSGGATMIDLVPGAAVTSG